MMKLRWPASCAAAISTGLIALAGPALAYFNVDGDGDSGFARAGALGTPSVTALRLAGIVTFTVAHPVPGLTPQGYHVTTGNENNVCSIHGAAGHCTDAFYFLGQTFHIRSYLGSWTSAPATCTFAPGAIVGTCGSGEVPIGIGIDLHVSTPVLAVSDDLGVSSSDGITNKTKVHLVGTGPIGATVVLLDGATEIGHGTVGTDGHYSVLATLAAGTHTVRGYAKTDGDQGPQSDPGTIKVDLTPTAPATKSTSDPTPAAAKNTSSADKGTTTDPAPADTSVPVADTPPSSAPTPPADPAPTPSATDNTPTTPVADPPSSPPVEDPPAGDSTPTSTSA